MGILICKLTSMELEWVGAWYPKETYIKGYLFILNDVPMWFNEGILNSIYLIDPITSRQDNLNVEFEWVLLGTAKDL